MKNSHKEARRSNFLLAAEVVFIANGSYNYLIDFPVRGRDLGASPWACNVMADLGCEEGSPEQELFAYYFKQEVNAACGGWWHKTEVDARVIGLLLCAEMLRR